MEPSELFGLLDQFGNASTAGSFYTITPLLGRSVENKVGFAGAVYDPATGMYLMRHRWYDPKLGRFITRDPAGYVDGSSLYQYVQGNPLLYFDPWGLFLEWAKQQVASYVAPAVAVAPTVAAQAASAVNQAAGDAQVAVGQAINDMVGGDPSTTRGVVTAGAAVADSLTMGATSAVRDAAGIGDGVNTESGLYQGVSITTDVVTMASPAGLAKSAAKKLGKELLEGASESVAKKGTADGTNLRVGVGGGGTSSSVDVPVPMINGRPPRNSLHAGGRHPKTGVPFDQQGFPNFSGYAKETHVVDGGFGTNGPASARAANIAMGRRGYDTPDAYIWHHHQDGKTMQLVPRDIHEKTGHTGGLAVNGADGPEACGIR